MPEISIVPDRIVATLVRVEPTVHNEAAPTQDHSPSQLARNARRLDAFAQAQERVASVLVENTAEQIAHMSSEERAQLAESIVSSVRSVYPRRAEAAIRGAVQSVVDREVEIQTWYNKSTKDANHTNLLKEAYAQRGMEAPESIMGLTDNDDIARIHGGVVIRNVPTEVFTDLIIAEVQTQQGKVDKSDVIKRLNNASQLAVTVDARTFLSDPTIPEGTKIVLVRQNSGDDAVFHEVQEILGLEIDQALASSEVFRRRQARFGQEIAESHNPHILTAIHDIAARLSEGKTAFSLGSLGLTPEDAVKMPEAVRLVKAINLAIHKDLERVGKEHPQDKSALDQRKIQLARWVQGGVIEPVRLLQVLSQTEEIQELLHIDITEKSNYFGQDNNSLVLTPSVDNSRFIYREQSRDPGDTMDFLRDKYEVTRVINPDDQGSDGTVYLVVKLEPGANGQLTRTNPPKEYAIKETRMSSREVFWLQMFDSTQQQQIFDGIRRSTAFNLKHDILSQFNFGVEETGDIHDSTIPQNLQRMAEVGGMFIRKLQPAFTAHGLAPNLFQRIIDGDQSILNSQQIIDLQLAAIDALGSLMQDIAQVNKLKTVFAEAAAYQQEADNLRRLDDVSGLPRVYGYEVTEITDRSGRQAWVANTLMEYVSGYNLEKISASAMPWSTERAIDVTIELARIASEAAARGIIHTDIKLQNTIGEVAGGFLQRVTLLDLANPQSKGKGSPFYAAPEQWITSSVPITEKTATYALGIILFELVTDVHDNLPTANIPFMREREIRRILSDRDVPQAVASIIIRATSEDMARRQTPAELQDELLHLRGYTDMSLQVLDDGFRAMQPLRSPITSLHVLDTDADKQELRGYFAYSLEGLSSLEPVEALFQRLENFDSHPSRGAEQFAGLIAARSMGNIIMKTIDPAKPAFMDRRRQWAMRWWTMLDHAGTGQERGLLNILASQDVQQEVNRFYQYINIICTSSNRADQRELIKLFGDIIQTAPQLGNLWLKQDLARRMLPRVIDVVRNLERTGETITSDMLDILEKYIVNYNPDPLKVANWNDLATGSEADRLTVPVRQYIAILSHGLGSNRAAIITRLTRMEGIPGSGIYAVMRTLAHDALGRI